MVPVEIAYYYKPILNLTILLLSIIAYNNWNNRNAYDLINNNKTNFILVTAALFVLCIFIGFRPLSGQLFGDTIHYAENFEGVKIFGPNDNLDNEGKDDEWLWLAFLNNSADYISLSTYFTIIAIGYVFFAYLGIKRLFKNNTYGALLFYLGAFSFYSYGVNGIRNGLACAMVVCAISFFVIPNKKNFIITALLCLLAVGIHKSSLLPIMCMFTSLFVRNVKLSISFWFFSILLYLFFRNPIENFFTDLGFDSRLSQYIETGEDGSIPNEFKKGFRLDFLIYSFLPIALGLYTISKLKTNINLQYKIILNTYIFANAFWVMLMNAAFSNRFAYLSWFLYPVVLAYPCLKLNIWGTNQGKNAGVVLVLHSLFTCFMEFVYYA